MVGILVSVWDGLFSGGMLVLGSVIGFAFDDVRLFPTSTQITIAGILKRNGWLDNLSQGR